MLERSTWVSLLVFGVLLLVAPWASARAEAQQTIQEVVSATLSPIDASEFPRMTAYLDVRDAQGEFVHNLQPNQVQILEDEKALSVEELEEEQPGALMVVAISPGRSFAIRDGQGISRYDRLVKAWQNWGNSQMEAGGSAESGSGKDDYSLLINNGPVALHLTENKKWLAVLEEYQADQRSAEAGLDVLIRAMEVASEAPPRPGMGRVILFVTPPPEGDFTAGAEAIIARAHQQGIRLFVWMIASPEQFSSAGAVQLLGLANLTGGTLFAYSGAEPIPNLEEILRPVRSTYRLVYQSRVATSGPHQATIEIRLEGFNQQPEKTIQASAKASTSVSAPPQTFEVNVQPPNPVFIEPPAEILRESHADKQETESLLLPKEQILDVLVEFPDGYPRQVITLTLFVDGAPIARLTKPPFDKVTWDLSQYTENGEHLLRIEAVDSLGLRSSSREVPVKITIKYTPKSFLAMLTRGGAWIVGLAVILSGAVLALVLILAGRINPQKLSQGGENRWRRASWKHFGKKFHSDPVTQPVRGASIRASQTDAIGDSEKGRKAQRSREKTMPASHHIPGWMDRFQRTNRKLEPMAHALLARLVDVEEMTVPTPIPIVSDEVVLGRDPAQASLVLDDPSVEQRHALLSLSNGVYRISDQGSVAGTWVNYTPVSKEGVTLEHGDLIHIGRVGFRFLIREPARIRKPVIRREDRST